MLARKYGLFSNTSANGLCSAGVPSDAIIEVGETSFHLHKFPLLSRSKVLEEFIEECSNQDEKKCVIQVPDVPGGAKTFLLVAKFCYGVQIELNSLNIVSLRCAAEYLQMSEEHKVGNLIKQTEAFLNKVFGNWTDSLKALETCEEVTAQAEELHIVSRCIYSLAMKACADPSFISWPMQRWNDVQSTGSACWNGICTSAKPHPVGEDWWYDDVSFLRLPLYKRLILAVGSHGMKPERIAGALIHYSRRHLSLLGRDLSTRWGNYTAPGSKISASSEADQRNLLEEIVELVPDQTGVTPSKFLLRLLRTAIMVNASPSCRETLEKRIGAQLDQAALEDLLIPSTGYSVETHYDIDCVQRILDRFMLSDSGHLTTNYMVEEGPLMGGSCSLTPLAMVANLMDNYLAEVATDVNLKLKKFQTLAGAIPDYSRILDDGIYRAIDVYLKAHPWLTESEREQLCGLMNCQKFSLEASAHAAQNGRLPLRIIVQVLFFEQLRLGTSISSWFFVSDNLEHSQNPNENPVLIPNEEHTQAGDAQDLVITADAMKKRVSELEKECSSMRQEIEKLGKTKGSWNTWLKKFGFSRPKPKSQDQKIKSPTNCKESGHHLQHHF